MLSEWGKVGSLASHLPPSKAEETRDALKALQGNVRALGLNVSDQELSKLARAMFNTVADIQRLPEEKKKAE
jgi:hypothetical protein